MLVSYVGANPAKIGPIKQADIMCCISLRALPHQVMAHVEIGNKPKRLCYFESRTLALWLFYPIQIVEWIYLLLTTELVDQVVGAVNKVAPLLSVSSSILEIR